MDERIKKFMKYVGTSLASTIIDLIFFEIFLFVFEKFKIYPDVFHATICARIISSVFDYYLNRNLVFKSSGSKRKQFSRHVVVIASQMILSATSLTVVDSIFKGSEILEKCIIDTLLFFFAYFLQKLWVYKEDNIKRD